MAVITIELVKAQPAGLRNLVGAHLAAPRWQTTCEFFNHLSSRERQSVCFHALLKQRHAVMRFEEMADGDRGRVACALDELRACFDRSRKVGLSPFAFIGKLTVSQRRTLFFHAGLTESEFNRPLWELERPDCSWRDALFRALRELFSLFEHAPTILTAVKPEYYLH